MAGVPVGTREYMCNVAKLFTAFTCEPSNLLNMPGHRPSELQLPPRIERGLSIRHDHSIISVLVPCS